MLWSSLNRCWLCLGGAAGRTGSKGEVVSPLRTTSILCMCSTQAYTWGELWKAGFLHQRAAHTLALSSNEVLIKPIIWKPTHPLAFKSQGVLALTCSRRRSAQHFVSLHATPHRRSMMLLMPLLVVERKTQQPSQGYLTLQLLGSFCVTLTSSGTQPRIFLSLLEAGNIYGAAACSRHWSGLFLRVVILHSCSVSLGLLLKW